MKLTTIVKTKKSTILYSIISYLLHPNLFIYMTKKGTGALIDNRPPEEKEKDYHLEELVANLQTVNWEEKEQWPSYPIYDQNGSGSCVAQTVAKMLGIMYALKFSEYLHFSATHVYQRRVNKPSGGMIAVDALNIARQGVTLESLTPSQNMTDAQMDAVIIQEYKKEVGKVFKANNFVKLKTRSIEDIASTIQATGKPVMVWYWFKHKEWKTIPEVQDHNLSLRAGSRHSVTAHNFTILGKEHTKDRDLWGKKALIIDDSWGTEYGEKGQRFITEDFHNERNFFAGYLTSFKFEKSEPDKKIHFNVTMRKGQRSAEIIKLQNFLKSKGLFPTNVDSTGYFGSITKKAVIKFQQSRGLVPDGIVGRNTLQELNK